MIDLQTLPADEAERIAYAEGFTGTAALFARIADLELQVAMYTEENKTLRKNEEELRDALYVALPFVEDVMADPAQLACFKPGVVRKAIKQIMAALGEER